MNERSDFGPVLRLWLEQDGPNTMPDRVVDVVADRIARQPQRRAWRLLGRPRTMNRTLTYAAALAAVVLVAIVGWRLLPGDGGIGSINPTPTPSPTVAAGSGSPAPAPTRGWWLGSGSLCGLPVACAGELAPGTHSSRSIRPSFTFAVPDGWVNVADWHDVDDYFALAPDTPANRAAAATGEEFVQSIVIGPHRPVVGANCVLPQADVGLRAAEIVTALSAREGLEASVPETVTISGLAGRQIDASLELGWTGACPDDPGVPAVGLLAGRRAQGDNRQRLIILDTPDCGETVEQGPICASGGNISIVIYTDRAADFDAFLSAAMPIVESLEFDLP